MGKDKKDEASVVSNVSGFQGPMSAKKKKNFNKPFGEAELFENSVAYNMLDEDDMAEVVRKVGTQWMLYDDETDAQIGAYNDRDTAWEKQRQIRRHKAAQRKSKEAERKRQKQSLKPTLAPKAKTARTPETYSKQIKKKKTEALIRDAIKQALHERSMVSYVFENTPVSDESALWDVFLSKLSKQTIMSDPKFKAIIQKSAQAEVKLLSKAIDVIKQGLAETGTFDVEKKGIEKDADAGDIKANFVVKLKENNQSLPFSIKLENGKPLIMFPEQTKAAINQMANKESKLLRAELMHIQETALDTLDDVVSINSKRDSYLATVEGKLDKFLNSLNFLEIAVLRYILKMKYKGLK